VNGGKSLEWCDVPWLESEITSKGNFIWYKSINSEFTCKI
jgi:hypothetical protein